jgi:hypothetical protein
MKATIAIITLALALVGGVWLLDDRNEAKFARADDLTNQFGRR